MLSNDFSQYNFVVYLFALDEVSTIHAVEGERLNIKCGYPEDVKILKTHWTKESDDETPFVSPNTVSKKLQWYVFNDGNISCVYGEDSRVYVRRGCF